MDSCTANPHVVLNAVFQLQMAAADSRRPGLGRSASCPVFTGLPVLTHGVRRMSEPNMYGLVKGDDVSPGRGKGGLVISWPKLQAMLLDISIQLAMPGAKRPIITKSSPQAVSSFATCLHDVVSHDVEVLDLEAR